MTVCYTEMISGNQEIGSMSLECSNVSMREPVCDEIKKLCETSFPPNEWRPFSDLYHDFGDKCELLAFYDDRTFVGSAIMLTFGGITHILYLAVKPELRDRGYGSMILEHIRMLYRGQRIIADLEDPENDSPNRSQREKRIVFYRKNGYSPTEIRYKWENEYYLIMSNGGEVTWEEFRRFWRYFYPG